MSFIEELKRRKVFRVAASYAVVAFIIMQLVEIVFPIFDFPQWTSQFVIILVLIGFPISVIISWVFDRTPQGYIKTESVPKPQVKADSAYKENQSFYKNKKNWLLIAGVIAGMVIGRFGQTPISSDNLINEKSIAVLPFDNLGNEQEDEYFADGMTEDILTELSKIKDLLVISRTTIMKYKNTNKSLKEIGKELGVANILEGTIRRVGERVRITGQLINAISDKHLWAEKYDRDIKDIFAVQDEVANAIANALRIELSDEESMMISESQTESIEAYDYYIKGRRLSYFYESAKREEALENYKKAIQIDPNYALPYAGISRVRISQISFQPIETNFTSIALKEAEKYAKKSVALGPNIPEAHFALGFFYNQTEKYDLAFESFNTAIMLNPSHAHAHDEIADVYLYKYGDFNRAIPWYDKALRIDPELVPSKWFKSEILLRKGQVIDGLDLIEEALAQHPNVIQFSTLKHVGLSMAGKHEDAYRFILGQENLYIKENSLLQYYQAVGLSLLYLNKMSDFDQIIKNISNISYSDKTHQKKYLINLRNFMEKKYLVAIEGFENLDNSYIYTLSSGFRRALSDVFTYWRAKSYIEMGDYQNALKQTFRFRPVNNQITGQFVFDQYWPKKDYLKGLAYEGLGDNSNARDSYLKFLRTWSDADENLPEVIDAKKRLRNLGWNS
jgi:TolB-like protein/TPR repeat protein